MKNIIAYSLQLILLLLLVTSCTKYDDVVESNTKTPRIITNQNPTSARIALEADTVLINGTIGISCIVEDPDENEHFTFEWASFKATGNSTDDNYEFDYWNNRGEFVQGGANALWTPGLATGKYVIFCSAQDKGGATLFTTKIINASIGAGIFALTDSLSYLTDGTPNSYNSLYIRTYNYSNEVIEIDRCHGPQVTLETRVSNKWNYYSDAGGGCTHDSSPFGLIGCGMYQRSNAGLPAEPGVYRFKVEYWLPQKRNVKKYIYTTEFEVTVLGAQKK